jgi:serine/threonine protein phosphatase PrpC
MMATDNFSPYASLRREVSERLHSFFADVSDGRATCMDAGAAIASSQGPHREQNEDRSAIIRFRFGSVRPDLRLAILCDGMGGMSKGGEAAALAIGSFIASFATIEMDCDLVERMSRSCVFANKAVFNAYQGNAGTTLTAIAFANHARCVVHVGDSRLYGIDNERNVQLLTKDDTVSGAVNAHLGQSAEDEMDNRLLQFVGIGPALTPSIINVATDHEHGLWLLTSDGAHSVGRRTLTGICEGSKGPYDLVRKLVYVSEAMNTQDNSSAICIKSGYVKSNFDEHEGLTIQITSPDKNLEIWLPPSALHLSTVAPEQSLSEQEKIHEEIANLSIPSPVKKKPLRRVTRRPLKLAATSTTVRRKPRAAKVDKQVMDFIFEADEDSDD